MALHPNKRGVALGLVVGLLAGAAGGALATTGGSKATATTTTTPFTTKQAVVDAFLSDLAGRLGTDVSKLTDAIKGAAIDQVNQAAKDGRLTQDEANAIIARINSGDFGPGFRSGLGFGFGRPGFGHMGARIDAVATAASYLGLTEAQLQAQLQSGKSLADIAKATPGKTVTGLEDALVAAATKAIDANTNLTADQKAQLIAKVNAMVDALVNKTPGTIGPRGADGLRLHARPHDGRRHDRASSAHDVALTSSVVGPTRAPPQPSSI